MTEQEKATELVQELKKKYKVPGRVTSVTLSKAMGICPRTFYKRIRTNGWTQGDIIVIKHLASM